MVNPFAVDLYLLTGRTWPWLLVHYLGFWLNPSDEKKHHCLINYGDTLLNYNYLTLHLNLYPDLILNELAVKNKI